jgi:hypothetical protein
MKDPAEEGWNYCKKNLSASCFNGNHTSKSSPIGYIETNVSGINKCVGVLNIPKDF